jgi:hypothetical protein
MEGAQALKRKGDDVKVKKEDLKDTKDMKDRKIKVERTEAPEMEKKRKGTDDQVNPPVKKKKKNKDKDRIKSSRDSSPMSIASTDSRTTKIVKKPHTGMNGADGVNKASVPPPPSSTPPPLPLPPPLPPVRIPGPPPAAARKPEDVLFVKKKKKVSRVQCVRLEADEQKPNGPGMGGPSAAPAGGQGVRAAIKDQLQGGRR